MPTLEQYRKWLGVNNGGQARKNDSDSVIENTWWEDPNARIAYFYDQEHDDEFDVADGLHPELSQTKIPIEVKHFEMTYNSLSKDQQAYHLQFKPSYVPDVLYYDQKFAEPYKATFPIGLYFDVADSKGVFHRWLVVGEYRHYSNQFPTYLTLPCDYKLQWIYENKKYESWAVSRSQNSYNSGLWTDYKLTSPENQRITWLPMNNKTSNIFYNQRVIISEPRKEPLVWKCSKVEDMAVKGTVHLTWAQDQFNPNTDYVEYDDYGICIGMWADYYSDGVIPKEEDETPSTTYSVITYTGKPRLTIDGGYKTFTVTFYNGDEAIDYIDGTWSITIDGTDISDLVETTIEENKIKIKFIGDDSYISKNAIITHTTDNGISSSVTVNIIGL